jgi:hypothetical protein
MKTLNAVLFTLVLVLAGFLVGSCLLSGCASVSPTADPLVVHVEQTEAIAFNTFDTFLKIDDLIRTQQAAGMLTNLTTPYINSPAHKYAETLRQPVLDGTNLTRQGLLWITQLDRIKLAYEAGSRSSNDVAIVLAVVATAINTAQVDIAQYGGITNK